MPTFYRTGIGADGRSCVVERRDLPMDLTPFGVPIDEVVPTIEPTSSDVPLLRSRQPPGMTRLSMFCWKPGVSTALHRTLSLDFDTVLAGSIELLLEAESVQLETGDSVFMPGSVHGWVTGPTGAIVSFVLLSAAEPANDVGRVRLEMADIMRYPAG